jgi:AmmeMemoRadiSam system protein B
MHVRAAAVAGLFYPADPIELEALVSGLLARAETRSEPDDATLKAVVVPHAGYVYSGAVAANAYARLRAARGRIRRVVLLGPSHRVALRGLAAPSAESFRTPLGLVPIDRDAITSLAGLPGVGVSDRPHAQEHSLEVQLPFLQVALDDFALVPLVVGEATDEEVQAVIERLWGGEETVFVVSSDLSHYHDYATAHRLDAQTCEAIEALAAEALDRESACGRVPLRGLLCAARGRGLAARTLDLRSSGDTAGDRDRVVGYGAWSFAPRA